MISLPSPPDITQLPTNTHSPSRKPRKKFVGFAKLPRKRLKRMRISSVVAAPQPLQQQQRPHLAVRMKLARPSWLVEATRTLSRRPFTNQAKYEISFITPSSETCSLELARRRNCRTSLMLLILPTSRLNPL